MNDKDWTEGRIKYLLLVSDIMVERSLLILHDRQRMLPVHMHKNDIGFILTDVEFLSGLVKHIKKSTWWGSTEGKCLSPKQLVCARNNLLTKYVPQLTKYANARKEIEVQHALGCFDYSHELRLAGGRCDDPVQ